MDGYGALERSVGCAGIHHVEHAVDRLVAAGSQDRGAEDLVRLSVHDDLHEPLRLALLDGTGDTGHRTLADQQRPTRCLRLRYRHSDPSERRIDVERVRGDAITHPPLLTIEKIGGHDLE